MKKLKQKIKDRLGEKNTEIVRKLLRAGRVIKKILSWVLIVLLTLAVIVFVVSKIQGKTPSIFGYSVQRIVSGSMEPELMVGDVIVSMDVTDTSEVHIGDIVTFQGDNRFENQKVTHRVIVAPYNDGNGGIVIVTQGDANDKDDGEINFYDVESKYIAKADILKYIYDFFFSKWGLIVFIFLLLVVFFDEILNIVKVSVYSAEEDETESIQEIIERVKQEQLAENILKQSGEEVADDAVEAPPEPTKKEKAIVKKGKTNNKQSKEKNKKQNNNKKKPKSGNNQKNQVKGKSAVKKKSKKKSKKRKKR